MTNATTDTITFDCGCTATGTTLTLCANAEVEHSDVEESYWAAHGLHFDVSPEDGGTWSWSCGHDVPATYDDPGYFDVIEGDGGFRDRSEALVAMLAFAVRTIAAAEAEERKLIEMMTASDAWLIEDDWNVAG